MALPIRLGDLVADQPIDGLCIGHPQQCFGEAQKRHPLRRGQRVFVQECIDAAFTDALAADIGDEKARAVGDSFARLGRDLGRSEDAGGRLGLVDPAIVRDRGAKRRGQRKRSWRDEIHAENIGIAAAECSFMKKVQRG
jgi:hypothetical protein